MARTVSAVSLKDSPFESEDDLAAKFIVSADRALAAFSNDIRVRVEFSKNISATVFPRKAGTFGTVRPSTSTKLSARSSS
jgi:hypothetical protein